MPSKRKSTKSSSKKTYKKKTKSVQPYGQDYKRTILYRVPELKRTQITTIGKVLLTGSIYVNCPLQDLDVGTTDSERIGSAIDLTGIRFSWRYRSSSTVGVQTQPIQYRVTIGWMTDQVLTQSLGAPVFVAYNPDQFYLSGTPGTTDQNLFRTVNPKVISVLHDKVYNMPSTQGPQTLLNYSFKQKYIKIKEEVQFQSTTSGFTTPKNLFFSIVADWDGSTIGISDAGAIDLIPTLYFRDM